MKGSQLIGKMILDYRAAKILFVAVYHDFFSSISHGCETAVELSKKHKTNPRATEILLDALTALGFLQKQNGHYSCDPEKTSCLIDSQTHPMANNVRFQELIGDAWADLRNVVSSGKVRKSLLPRLSEETPFTREYIRGMKNIAMQPAKEIAELFSSASAKRLLDVGAGPGTYSLALLEKTPSLHADLLDLPTTLSVTQELLAEYPDSLSKRAHCKEGNYHTADFGLGLYDLVLMSHITHDEGEEEVQRLFEKAHASLRPGGRIIIHDFVVSEDRTEPIFDAVFAVHMLVYTEKGRVYTQKEYTSWLQKAGFHEILANPINTDSLNRTMAISGIRH